MASGFLVLSDGRCFAKSWSFHDRVLLRTAEQLPANSSLRAWLLEQLPGPTDLELGHGSWYRAKDGVHVERYLDLREFTPEIQAQFTDAVLRAVEVADASERALMSELADMVARQRRGEPPLSRSDWQELVPSRGRKIGPGWSAA